MEYDRRTLPQLQEIAVAYGADAATAGMPRGELIQWLQLQDALRETGEQANIEENLRQVQLSPDVESGGFSPQEGPSPLGFPGTGYQPLLPAVGSVELQRQLYGPLRLVWDDPNKFVVLRAARDSPKLEINPQAIFQRSAVLPPYTPAPPQPLMTNFTPFGFQPTIPGVGQQFFHTPVIPQPFITTPFTPRQAMAGAQPAQPPTQPQSQTGFVSRPFVLQQAPARAFTPRQAMQFQTQLQPQQPQPQAQQPIQPAVTLQQPVQPTFQQLQQTQSTFQQTQPPPQPQPPTQQAFTPRQITFTPQPARTPQQLQFQAQPQTPPQTPRGFQPLFQPPFQTQPGTTFQTQQLPFQTQQPPFQTQPQQQLPQGGLISFPAFTTAPPVERNRPIGLAPAAVAQQTKSQAAVIEILKEIDPNRLVEAKGGEGRVPYARERLEGWIRRLGLKVNGNKPQLIQLLRAERAKYGLPN
jgi:hypothetical protein